MANLSETTSNKGEIGSGETARFREKATTLAAPNELTEDSPAGSRTAKYKKGNTFVIIHIPIHPAEPDEISQFSPSQFIRVEIVTILPPDPKIDDCSVTHAGKMAILETNTGKKEYKEYITHYDAKENDLTYLAEEKIKNAFDANDPEEIRKRDRAMRKNRGAVEDETFTYPRYEDIMQSLNSLTREDQVPRNTPII